MTEGIGYKVYMFDEKAFGRMYGLLIEHKTQIVPLIKKMIAMGYNDVTITSLIEFKHGDRTVMGGDTDINPFLIFLEDVNYGYKFPWKFELNEDKSLAMISCSAVSMTYIHSMMGYVTIFEDKLDFKKEKIQ